MSSYPHAPAVFQTPPYLMAYRRFFGAGKHFHRFRIVEKSPTTSYRSLTNDRLAPETGAAFLMTRGHTVKRLEWWGAGIHDIGDVSCTCRGAAQQLWHHIEQLAARHDAAQLAQIDARSPLIELARQGGWHIAPAEACPVLQLPGAWTEYVASLGKNMREQIKRYPRRLEKQFSVQYELAQSEDEVQRALTNLFSLHGKRWRARGQTGVLALPRRRQFHRTVCAAFFKRGWLRLWTLRCDGQPACVLLNYFYGGRYYFFIGGFEPEMMRWSVGTCLFARVLQHAIEEGASEFDFLRGEEEYKYRFGAVNRDYLTITTFRPSPRGHLMHRRLQLEAALTRGIHHAFSAAHRNKEK